MRLHDLPQEEARTDREAAAGMMGATTSTSSTPWVQPARTSALRNPPKPTRTVEGLHLTENRPVTVQRGPNYTPPPRRRPKPAARARGLGALRQLAREAGISRADWSAFLEVIERRRDELLDAQFHPGMVEELEGLEPLARHLLREVSARAAGHGRRAHLEDLILGRDTDTGELLLASKWWPPIRWRAES